MKTELLHKYFRGETTEKEENQIVEWVESSVENKEQFWAQQANHIEWFKKPQTILSEGENNNKTLDPAS